jgi:putative transposase
MLKATKVRLYPTPEQKEYLNAQFGAVRFSFNKALAIKNHEYKLKGNNLSPKKDLKPLLAFAKKSRKYAWLKDYDSIALQQAVINLDAAFKNFFNPKLKARFPRFKSKYGKQSSYHCVGVKVFGEAIKIPKLDPIPAVIHREIDGDIKSITITRTATGKFFASILVDDHLEQVKPMKKVKIVTGLDLGLTHFAIQDNGKKHSNPKFIKRAERNLRRKQKALSRKLKGGANRAKARLLVAKCHEKIASARAEFQHNLSRQIVDESQAVIVETLKSANMMKNRKLSKAIADASWHSFVAKLEYKAKELGKHLIKIDQWYASSKTCSTCDFKVDNMPLNIRNWDCPNCDAKDIDRDINAAINIKNQGIIELKAAGLVVSAY